MKYKNRITRSTPIWAGLIIAVVLFFGFAGATHALTQSDVDLLCIIFDCDEAGIRDTLEGLIDDEAEEITRNLFRGISGDDVTQLQEFLAEDPDIYPEGLVTGFYGPLTERAVLRFQEQFGIEQVGTVGPVTRGTLSDVVEGEEDEDAEEEIGDSDSGDVALSHKVKICHKGKTIAVGAPAVQAHVRHGDEVGACGSGNGDDDDGDDDSDDTTAPEILAGPQAVNIDSDSADIDWDTDEESDSAVWYSETSGFDKEDTGVETKDKGDLETSHRLGLSSLDPETTYYYFVESSDDAGNTVTSGEESFSTLSETSAPEIIAGPQVVNIGSTIADIDWDTDEASDSTVWYSETSPVDPDNDPSESESADVTSHSVRLENLTPGTEYFYIVGSEDPDGNEVRSEEGSFTTE